MATVVVTLPDSQTGALWAGESGAVRSGEGVEAAEPGTAATGKLGGERTSAETGGVVAFRGPSWASKGAASEPVAPAANPATGSAEARTTSTQTVNRVAGRAFRGRANMRDNRDGPICS